MPIEKHHHEVATGGQCELGFRFASLVKAADYLMTYKYCIKNVGKSHGKTVTFMPKPLFNDNGSGMHTHQSIWKDGQPLFWGEGGYANLSQMALHYIGGLLKHAPALLALTNPSTNSYKRLVPGFEAPVNLAYSQGNRSASIRIPLSGTNPKAKRLEFRAPHHFVAGLFTGPGTTPDFQITKEEVGATSFPSGFSLSEVYGLAPGAATDPAYRTIQSKIPFKNGRYSEPTILFQLTPDGWRFVVPPSVVSGLWKRREQQSAAEGRASR